MMRAAIGLTLSLAILARSPARGGDPRAMRGPTVLDSVQVRQVAGYVWAISRARREPRSTSGAAAP